MIASQAFGINKFRINNVSKRIHKERRIKWFFPLEKNLDQSGAGKRRVENCTLKALSLIQKLKRKKNLLSLKEKQKTVAATGARVALNK